jgi:hypothetical protein
MPGDICRAVNKHIQAISQTGGIANRSTDLHSQLHMHTARHADPSMSRYPAWKTRLERFTEDAAPHKYICGRYAVLGRDSSKSISEIVGMLTTPVSAWGMRCKPDLPTNRTLIPTKLSPKCLTQPLLLRSGITESVSTSFVRLGQKNIPDLPIHRCFVYVLSGLC